jgi:membrane protein DedA with SNARE-associated domain
MDLEGFLRGIVDFTATLDPRMALLFFVICCLGEIGISILFLLEFLWVNVGINVGTGKMPPWHLLGLWLCAQVGRQLGSLILYRIARFGMPALTRFYHKIRLDRFINKLIAKSGPIARINIISPFSVAFARLIGGRFPMLLVMAAKKRFRTLALGIILSSIIFDGLYIAVGAIFGMTIEDIKKFNPLYTVLITVGLLAVIYLVTFTIRFFIKRRRQLREPTEDISAPPPGDDST